ncbi:YciI family protein [Cellulomonas bogoriensis]|uniref:YCII-related domain-containing protein n=1 Tax=Cellulomonas bogoriensis 69B4 = DSM 16987 TaxID=1386082 RepID=A0A0A0C1E4_9CELL|nr:YciI family protein [Cellulomonas bogoriensis]KGM14478.1 hypothetical protein N869_08815 [Cellulomonas bogoriensis 69B4 = DSM 16987]
MSTYCVEYVYDDRDDRRSEVRPEHREFLKGLLARDVLLASGPWVGPPSPEPAGGAAAGALLVLRGDSPEGVLAVLDQDPFRREGLVTERVVRRWDPVIGPWS